MKLSEFITNEFINKNHNKELCLIRIKDFNYDENEKQWELSRNRMIEKTINAIKLGEIYMNED